MKKTEQNAYVVFCTILFGTWLPVVAGMVSPDAKFVAYAIPRLDDDANLCTEIFVQATDGTVPRSLGTLPESVDQVNWIGNDRIAVNELTSVDRLAVLDTTSRRLPDLKLPPKCDVLYLAVSPNGEKIAFTGSRQVGEQKSYGLFICDLDGGEVRLLIGKALKTVAAWSPDSRRLAIGAAEGYTRNYPLQLVDAATGEIDDTGLLGVGTAWSPDGKLIACTTEVKRGGSWYQGIPTDGKLALYDVEARTMRVLEETGGAFMPVWSGTGSHLAYHSGEDIWVVPRNGGKPVKIEGTGNAHGTRVAWAGDTHLYIWAREWFGRVELPGNALVKLAEWERPEPPRLKSADFKRVEVPRVTVRYARFGRNYAEALANILREALTTYESLGFQMPPSVQLEASIDPSGTRLWTDGESKMFLHLKSKELLAPASRTGVFNIYGMCHELGHIAMYRNLKSLMGLPSGVGEGWAHYAGSIVVTEVAAKLGKSIWPEYYDVADVEGIGRLKPQAEKTGADEESDPTTRAALAFYRLQTEFGRDKLMAAMSGALAERPIGRDIMPLLVQKLRQTTSRANAASWITEDLLVAQVRWNTREPNPGAEFFAPQKIEPDKQGCWLVYDDGTMEDKRSMSGAAETMLFQRPPGAWRLDGLKVFSGRYGSNKPPRENISIYICDAEFKLLREVEVPYSRFEKGEMKWHTVSFAAVEVPDKFYLGLDFHATATKGVYVGLDKSVEKSHSRIAMPYGEVGDLRERADWMIRPHLSAESE